MDYEIVFLVVEIQITFKWFFKIYCKYCIVSKVTNTKTLCINYKYID
jgi:hypothetical protein